MGLCGLPSDAKASCSGPIADIASTAELDRHCMVYEDHVASLWRRLRAFAYEARRAREDAAVTICGKADAVRRASVAEAELERFRSLRAGRDGEDGEAGLSSPPRHGAGEAEPEKASNARNGTSHRR